MKEKVAKLAKEMIEKLRGMLRKVKDLFRKVEGVVWDEEMGDTEEGMGED